MSKKIVIILVGLLLMSNVNAFGKKEHPKLDDDKFVELYVKLAKATEEYLADSSKLAQEQNRIFKESGFTKKDFEIYMKELDKQPERWAKIWEKISIELEKINETKSDTLKELNPLPEPTVPPSLQKR